MASGHVNRIYRPNTWLHRPMLQNVKKALANSEPSTHGTKRTSDDVCYLVANGGKADMAGEVHFGTHFGHRLANARVEQMTFATGRAARPPIIYHYARHDRARARVRHDLSTGRV